MGFMKYIMNAVRDGLKNFHAHEPCIVPVDDLEKVRIDIVKDQKIKTFNRERPTLSKDHSVQKSLIPDDVDHVEEKSGNQ